MKTGINRPERNAAAAAKQNHNKKDFQERLTN